MPKSSERHAARESRFLQLWSASDSRTRRRLLDAELKAQEDARSTRRMVLAIVLSAIPLLCFAVIMAVVAGRTTTIDVGVLASLSGTGALLGATTIRFQRRVIRDARERMQQLEADHQELGAENEALHRELDEARVEIDRLRAQRGSEH